MDGFVCLFFLDFLVAPVVFSVLINVTSRLSEILFNTISIMAVVYYDNIMTIVD